MNTIRQYIPAQLFSLPRGPFSTLSVLWLLFAVSVTAFVSNYFIGDRLPGLGAILDMLSLVTCGFSWLLTRALFRQEDRLALWPQLVVATLFLSSLVLYVTSAKTSGGMFGYIANIQSLIGSTVLLMTFLEPLDGLKHDAPDRRFRLAFAAGYLCILGAAFLVRLPEFDPWRQQTQVGLAMTALIAASLAVHYRLRNPLVQPSKVPTRRAQASTPANPALARRLLALLEDERVYLDPHIKVATLSQMLRTPDYKITQCLVSDLGFKNFNQMVNAYRIDEAKRRLSSPEYDACAILIIAMDCGFASIGPFNRAFKSRTGTTPSAFRRQAKAAA